MRNLPDYFVWHTVGTESSLTLEQNFKSLEAQRRNNPDDIFLWGCGNSISENVLLDLLKATNNQPLLVFTPIKSAVRNKDKTHLDSDTKSVCLWQSIDQKRSPGFSMPIGAQVVSTAENDQGGKQNKKSHYALVCQSQKPLTPNMDSTRTLETDFLETHPRGNDPVNSSSVKVVHKLLNPKFSKREYPIILTVPLVPPYIVKLTNPQILSGVCMDPVTGQYPV